MWLRPIVCISSRLMHLCCVLSLCWPDFQNADPKFAGEFGFSALLLIAVVNQLMLLPMAVALNQIYFLQQRKICVFMDFLTSTGRLIYLQMKFLQRFQSLYWVLTLQEMERTRRTGYLWLLYTVTHG